MGGCLLEELKIDGGRNEERLRRLPESHYEIQDVRASVSG